MAQRAAPQIKCARKSKPVKPTPKKDSTMNIRNMILLACAALAAAPLSAGAAAITWSTPTTISADSDIYTAGTFISAYNLNTAGAGTINGVTFTGGNGRALGSYFGLTSATAYGGFTQPNGTMGAAYKTLLANGAYGLKGATLTLSNLVSGHQYAVQVWACAAFGGMPNTRHTTYTSAGGNTASLQNNNTGAAGGVGQFSIGTFTADAATQAISVNSDWTGDAYMNAIQLRDLGGTATTGAPGFSPAGGTYFGSQTVTLSSEAGATVFYTTDGTTPTNTSPHGTVGAGSVTLSLVAPTNITINAYATNSAKADSAVVSASYVVLAASSGIWTNNAGGTLSWKGQTNWQGGVLAFGSGNTADFSSLTMTANQTVTLDGALTIGNLLFGDVGQVYSWTLNTGTGGPLTLDAGASTPTITVSNTTATLNVALAGTNGWAKAGNGTLALPSKPNSIAGTAVVNGGTVTLTGANNNSSGVGCASLTINNGGTLTVNADNAIGATGVSNITLSTGGKLTMGGGRNVWVTQGGTMTLAGGDLGSTDAGNATYGTWMLYSTAVNVTDNSTISAQAVDIWGTSTFNVAAGKTLDVAGYFGGSGTGGLTKTGNGTLLLSGYNTAAGTVTVNAGTLGGVGRIAAPVVINSGGMLAPGTNGTIGTLTINNTLTLNAASTNVMRITKTDGYPASDQVAGVTGTLNYLGTLIVTNVTTNANALAGGDTFTLFTAGGYGGGFANVILPTLPAGLAWDTSQLTVSGQIAVSTVVYCATPVFSPVAGGYPGAQPVTITTLTPGATIYYTADNWATTNVYGGPVPVPAWTNVTLQAYAHKAGAVDSSVASATYVTWPTLTWISSVDEYWATASNWTNNLVANGSGVTADFSTLSLLGDTTVYLGANQTIGNMVFGDAGTNYNWTLADASGVLTLDSGNNVPTLTVNNMATTISATMTGSHGFAKAGNGTLILTKKLTSMSGTATVNGGTLSLASTDTSSSSLSAVGDALVINNGGTVRVSYNFALGHLLDSITLNSGGVLRLDGGVTQPLAQDGTVTFAGGDLSSAAATGSWVLNNTAFNVTDNSTLSAQNVNVSSGAGLNLTVAAGKTLNVTGNLTGGAAITKNGQGTSILGGTNTHSGSTLVNSGTLLVNGTLASTTVTVNSNATLGGTGTLAGVVAVSGTVSPGASIGQLTTGAETWYDGSTLIYQVASADTNSNAGRDLLTINGTLDLQRTNSGVFTIKLVSMADNTTPGNVPDFDPASNYTWTVGTATGLANPGNLAYIVVDASAFSNAHSGSFAPAFDPGSQAIQIRYTAPSVNTTPTNISASMSGGNLNLSWPSDHLGWRLEVQTNPRSTGLSNNWVTVTGSTNVTSMSIPINTANPTVFYRLVYP
jgi:autotransporter-associated beta strand protein